MRKEEIFAAFHCAAQQNWLLLFFLLLERIEDGKLATSVTEKADKASETDGFSAPTHAGFSMDGCSCKRICYYLFFFLIFSQQFRISDWVVQAADNYSSFSCSVLMEKMDVE